ncbi:MAPEG family protein [Aliidiomarina maris]|uniref:Putative MAPEG superfamily protein n=1 Tax=Aliidiomarina maris TaxID=531312 RepID=A0A327WU67_9GAMM|nr:MAPEG family protein [Aliidiomarina maris]RAJ96402.1 putative MAPEG superfamily protein [Aliidiomarina maris]
MQIDFSDYRVALIGVGLLLLMVFVQWMVGNGRKAKEAGALPGTPPKHLSHQDFTFRAWRTHQNTLENLGTMLGASFLAIVAGANPFWVALLVWVMLFGRLVHMILYYAIATDKNPSPRSYFFGLAWLANLALLILGLIALL